MLKRNFMVENKVNIISLTVLIILASITQGGAQTTLMSFNLRYNNPHDNENRWKLRKIEVAELIANYNPDILGIQEGLYNQITFLDSTLTDYSYTGVGRDDGNQKGEFTAIFYNTNKVKLINTITYWLSETPNKVSVGWDASMERITTFATFRNIETGDTLFVFNCHYDHIGKIAQEESSKLILEIIKDNNLQDDKVVVMGDFNSLPDDKPIKILKSILTDSFNYSTSETDSSGTFNGFNRNYVEIKRIDYIFVNNVSVKDYKIITDKRKNGLFISDHFPVWATIE